MNGKILQKGKYIGDIRQYDFYKTQNRATFIIDGALENGQKYTLELEGGKRINVLVTSTPASQKNAIVHVAIEDN